MIDFLIYPVSGVMKLWYLLLHSVLNVSEQTAWLLSIAGLIVTIRLLILPAAWFAMKAGRMNQLMRPKLHQVQQEHKFRTDAEADKWLREQTKVLQKEHNANPLAGCIPALIQVPVFIGLYQVLLRLASPQERTAEVHSSVGFLRPDDIASILNTKFFDVPIPAYLRMTQEQTAQLGTTPEAVRSVVLPMIAAAALFTFINMAFSTYRTYITMDWNMGSNVFTLRMLQWMAIIAPLLVFTSAYSGPFHLAIVLYWFGSNMWTMGQFFVLSTILDRKYPLSDEFKRFRDEGHEKWKLSHGVHKEIKRAIRNNRLKMIIMPWKIGELHRANVEMKQSHKQESSAEKQAAREAKKARQAAQKEHSRKRMLLSREQYRRKKAKLPLLEGEEIEEFMASLDEGVSAEGAAAEGSPTEGGPVEGSPTEGSEKS